MTLSDTPNSDRGVATGYGVAPLTDGWWQWWAYVGAERHDGDAPNYHAAETAATTSLQALLNRRRTERNQ